MISDREAGGTLRLQSDYEWEILVRGLEFEMRIFILVREMVKGPSDYL